MAAEPTTQLVLLWGGHANPTSCRGLPGIRRREEQTAQSLPERRHLGTNNITPTTNSATPLIKVQNRWEGGSHGGTIASKNSGRTKCKTPRSANSGAETDCEAWTR